MDSLVTRRNSAVRNASQYPPAGWGMDYQDRKSRSALNHLLCHLLCAWGHSSSLTMAVAHSLPHIKALLNPISFMCYGISLLSFRRLLGCSVRSGRSTMTYGAGLSGRLQFWSAPDSGVRRNSWGAMQWSAAKTSGQPLVDLSHLIR
jgi:hypothetical protein